MKNKSVISALNHDLHVLSNKNFDTKSSLVVITIPSFLDIS